MLIIQELLGYFLIGIIGMAILAVCYLPIYFIMRKRMPLLRQIAYFLFVVCVLVISTATFLDWVITCLLNGRAILATEHSLNLIPFRFITETWDMGVRKQITQTIVLASGVPNHILSGVLNQLLSEAYEPIEECKMPTTQICSL